MTTDADGFLEQEPARGLSTAGVRDLSAGTKLVLASGALVFLSLFLIWQNLEIDYGPAGTGTLMLDGWDALGLVIALLALGLVSLVVVLRLSDVEVSPDVDWDLVVLALASAILVLVLAKNLTDRDSAWGSYLAVVLAAGGVVGAFFDWSRTQYDRSGLRRRRRRPVTPPAA